MAMYSYLIRRCCLPLEPAWVLESARTSAQRCVLSQESTRHIKTTSAIIAGILDSLKYLVLRFKPLPSLCTSSLRPLIHFPQPSWARLLRKVTGRFLADHSSKNNCYLFTIRSGVWIPLSGKWWRKSIMSKFKKRSSSKDQKNHGPTQYWHQHSWNIHTQLCNLYNTFAFEGK